jgi:hypothetical protein
VSCGNGESNRVENMTPLAQRRYLCASKGLAVGRNAKRLVHALRCQEEGHIAGLFRVLANDLETLKFNNDELYYVALETILKTFRGKWL